LRQVRDRAYFFSMSKADEERAKRLAEALRQNLRLSPAQARGEEADKPSERDGDPT
jgi:hypothetical protein